MPRGDGTGPMGMGPMTGRAAGFCAGFSVPGYMNPFPRYGIGFGRGRGFRRMAYLTGLPGWIRFGYPWIGFGYPGYPMYYGGAYRTAPAADEKEFLKMQKDFLEEQLKQVNEQLGNLEKDTE
ncbi:MAG: DUF5320 domain-containing protein [Firmicutes bacterium]|nr:DUF5320 domain-containing protein [Bacillota bacterium]